VGRANRCETERSAVPVRDQRPAGSKRGQRLPRDGSRWLPVGSVGGLLLHVARPNGPGMVPTTIATAWAASRLDFLAQQVPCRLARAPVDATATRRQLIFCTSVERLPRAAAFEHALQAVTSAAGGLRALEAVMCGVLLRSASRSLGGHFRYLGRRTTTTSPAKPLKWLGPNLLFRPSISSDGAAAQQLLISVFGHEMYISQWWLVYLSLELLPAPCPPFDWCLWVFSSKNREILSTLLIGAWLIGLRSAPAPVPLWLIFSPSGLSLFALSGQSTATD
jgi:hypothetical protein